MSNQPIAKATLYVRDDLWAYSKAEVSNLTWKNFKQAQHLNALKFEFTERGKRKQDNHVIKSIPASAVVLEGWEHPTPPPKFSAPIKSVGYSVKENRFDVLDERWDVEFDAFLDSYIEKSNAKIILDLRTHNPMKTGIDTA